MYIFNLNTKLHLAEKHSESSELSLANASELLGLYQKKYFEDGKIYRIEVPNVERFFEQLKSSFTFIEAAGAFISYQDKYLMIHRLGFWDLPKGKVDPGETPRQTAVREVKEECALDISLKNALPPTYHIYHLKGKDILKCTHWFEAESQTAEVAPQEEENIDEVRWLKPTEIPALLPLTYASIKEVLAHFAIQ
jgi:8-oxo-dGTP pyrophosphatase MutT (NUDIX family)